MKFKVFTFSLLMLQSNLAVQAGIRLPALVGDHMVLQRDVKVPIWGWADPGEKVALTFQGKTYAATPATTGKWQIMLPAIPAGGPYTMTIKGQNTLTIQDILVGDVWLASGQSNMELPLRDPNAPSPNSYPLIVNAEQEVAAANFPRIRQFTVKKVTAYQPQTENQGYNWKVCSPSTAGQFSAVAYFFARDLYKRYNVPIGIISSPWGGTPAEAWVSGAALKTLPDFQAPVTELEQLAATVPATDNNAQNKPTTLYNGMIAPLIPYALKGVIWYQGESNANRGEQYRTLFPALIKDWRGRWGYEMPFLFVQLANFNESPTEPTESDWAELREAQAQALVLPRTGMAVALDIGDAKDIHPANKQDVGHRLALVARKVAYGDKQVVASGPTFQSMSVSGNTAKLRFTGVGSGLVVKGGNGALKGFAVAGADKKFYWATATVQGQDVVLSSSAVPTPVAVRYAWANNPEANLYNREGLPAAPFRTDQWEGITHGKK
ncbi:sialate O-acetylesterase [Hymenobacter sp.]|jgi:sialate O-acetylesterase|uniref:sialate O-acetylesterase n=1 Tax=Hymenobacter sp. TaxID=1898978 RepID=UPI002ED8A216